MIDCIHEHPAEVLNTRSTPLPHSPAKSATCYWAGLTSVASVRCKKGRIAIRGSMQESHAEITVLQPVASSH